MMKRTIVLLLILFFSNLSLASRAYGQEKVNVDAFTSKESTEIEYALPYPGILPDHPLYFLKNLRDKVLLFLTKDPIKKSQVQQTLADKHLVMGRMLLDKKKDRLATLTFYKGEKYLLDAVITLVKLKTTTDIPQGVHDRLKLSSKKHEEVITKLISFSSDKTVKQELEKSLEITRQATQQLSNLK